MRDVVAHAARDDLVMVLIDPAIKAFGVETFC